LSGGVTAADMTMTLRAGIWELVGCVRVRVELSVGCWNSYRTVLDSIVC